MRFSRVRCTEPNCQIAWLETDTDDPVMLDAIKCRQKERTFYLSFVSAEIVDALCDVPAINEEISFEDMADRCLTAMKEWQRPLDVSRVKQIGEFWRQLDNHLVNAPVIALRDSVEPEVVAIPVAGTIEPPLSVAMFRLAVPNWLHAECPKGHQTPTGAFADHCPEHDCEFHVKGHERPAIMIDGQHRTRGTQADVAVSEELTLSDGTNQYANEVPIPVVLLWSKGLDSFDYEKQAKIFTEITTQAEDLHYLHKLWLLYRFPGITARIPDLRETEQPITMDPTLVRGEGTRKAYETILRMAGTTVGATGPANPWRGGIPIVFEKARARRIASIDRLLPMLTEWHLPGGCLHGKSSGQAAALLRDYAKATMVTWDRLSPNSRSYYWIPPATTRRPFRANERGIISHPMGGQMSTWLRALIRLFPEVYRKLPAGATSPGVGDFVNIMKPLAHCNFEGDGWDDFPGQEVKEELLYEILKDWLVGTTVKQETKALSMKDLNDFVTAEPHFDLTVTSPGPSGSTGLPTVIPGTTSLAWRRPFNSFATSLLTITQEGNPDAFVDQIRIDRGNKHTFGISRNHFDPKLSGATISVRVSYENHTHTKSRLVDFETP